MNNIDRMIGNIHRKPKTFGTRSKSTPQMFSKTPKKTILLDGKLLIFKDKVNLTPQQIYKVYKKIPDNINIPIVFQTKRQYLREYINNQEKKHNIDFTKKQEQSYIKRELKDIAPIVSRYTTKKNKYIEPKTVFFTDTKWTPKQFKASAIHEVGHEIWESNKNIRKDWKSVNQLNSPTAYGRTSKEEDFAESYMLYKMGKLRQEQRLKILRDNISNNSQIYLSENMKESEYNTLLNIAKSGRHRQK